MLISEEDALMKFSLAPLEARRDIAMLGLIHRTVLGKGPDHFKLHFKLKAPGILKDPRDELGGRLISRSALGCVAIYNALPASWKTIKKVKDFQALLQEKMREGIREGLENWRKLSCPREPLKNHLIWNLA